MLGSAFPDVLAAAQGGDEAAFTALFRDVQPVLLRYLHIIGPHAAEDIASETWVRVVSGLPKFSGDERSFRAWLFTIARHRAIDFGRSRTRRASVPLDDSGAEELLTAPDAADVALERIATRSELRDRHATRRSGRDHPAARGGWPGPGRRGRDYRQEPGCGAGGRAPGAAPARAAR